MLSIQLGCDNPLIFFIFLFHQVLIAFISATFRTVSGPAFRPQKIVMFHNILNFLTIISKKKDAEQTFVINLFILQSVWSTSYSELLLRLYIFLCILVSQGPKNRRLQQGLLSWSPVPIMDLVLSRNACLCLLYQLRRASVRNIQFYYQFFLDLVLYTDCAAFINRFHKVTLYTIWL